MSPLLVKVRGPGSPLPAGRPFSTLEEGSVLCLSPNAPNSKGIEQDQAGQSQSYSQSTYLAETSLLPLPASTKYPTVNQAPNHSSSPVSGCGLHASPQLGGSTPQGVTPGWLSGTEVSCSMDVQQELLNSRKTSTCTSSLQKFF